MRILLIEDDKTIAFFIMKGLKEAGFVVDRAIDGFLGTLLNEVLSGVQSIIRTSEAITGKGSYGGCKG
ncbi:MAG: hypothetical protein NT010_05500 [Proteobacteria bacterium]|nr:hypothetical protein [Pseudomonadota bacterium]